MIALVLVAVVAYLCGSIPFGVLVAKVKGVDLRTVGSGNIGATNVGRALGRPYAVLVFVLDFTKGALPVACSQLLTSREPDLFVDLVAVQIVHIVAGAAALLGHLYPLFLGFRGGKGVAVGAGITAALVPVPFLAGLVAWLLVALLSRTVSLASLAAASMIVVVRVCEVQAWQHGYRFITAFVLLGIALVIWKHRSNIVRIIQGTENKIDDGAGRRWLISALYTLALSLTFGGSVFFNFVAAPSIFRSFKEVVSSGPTSRTAEQTIIASDADEESKAALSSALAGAAVGPIFPLYFMLNLGCLSLAFFTGLARSTKHRRLATILVGISLVVTAGGWLVSTEVSRLREERYSKIEQVRTQAKANFGPVHLVSLSLSVVGTLLSGSALVLASRRDETSAAVM